MFLYIFSHLGHLLPIMLHPINDIFTTPTYFL